MISNSSCRWIALTTAVVVVAGLFKAPHFVWWMSTPRQEHATEVRPLAGMEVDDDYSAINVGGLTIQLPHEFLNDSDPDSLPQEGDLVFRSGSRQIVLGRPHKSLFNIKGLSADLAPNRDSPCKLLETAYRASTSDFHWSMATSELRQLIRLLDFKQTACVPNIHQIETVYKQNIEALLLECENVASLQWFSGDGRMSGTILFRERQADTIDLVWVRPLCLLVEFSQQPRDE